MTRKIEASNHDSVSVNEGGTSLSREEEAVVIVKPPPENRDGKESSSLIPESISPKDESSLEAGAEDGSPLRSRSSESAAPTGKEDNGSDSLTDSTTRSPVTTKNGPGKRRSATGNEERTKSSSNDDRRQLSTASKHRLRVDGRRTRGVRTALIQDVSSKTITNKRPRKHSRQEEGIKGSATLPPYQYETTLVRRAIRKADTADWTEPNMETVSAGQSHAGPFFEVFGDVNLGMQLAPAGGKIIVQGLIPLKDGRASPSQLSGVIQRGDVLLQINQKSLVNIPFDELMANLTALSSPLADGTYARKITLRFAAGQGLDLLKRKEIEDQLRQRQNRTQTATSSPTGTTYGSNSDGAADILGLFTMVDQLSGMPMVMEQDEALGAPVQTAIPHQEEPSEAEEATDLPEKSFDNSVKSFSLNQTPHQRYVPLEEAISSLIAVERSAERDESDSEFFSWNESFSILLRKPEIIRTVAIPSRDPDSSFENEKVTSADLLEIGHQAFSGAQKLSAILEKLDRGWTDKRSTRSFAATLSLYSRASTRRRYVLDGKAMPVNFEQVREDDENSSGASDDNVGGSMGSDDEEEELEHEELLLQLAAQDDDWREKVVGFLTNVVKELNEPDDKSSKEKSSSVVEHDSPASAAVSTELGSFLFGDGMTKALMLHKKPQALPPDEITALLFDLTTNVSATVPEQINLANANVAARTSIDPFASAKTPADDSNVVRAGRFLLDDVLPVWLKTFRPLPWSQRRVLWPLERSVSTESTTVGSTRSDDSITVDSMGTQRTSMKRKAANLREQIENQELSVETRSETCFLVTFYFERKLLSQLRIESKDVDGSFMRSAEQFVNEYGAYLRLHTCFSYAAALKAKTLMTPLLDLAKHDPHHRESVRRFSRSGSLLFYEPATLSAVVARLHGIKDEADKDQRLVTIQLCASAYPDIQPWQVHLQCGSHHAILYYTYLCYLLHPSDGHDRARYEATLVLEWVDLSAQGFLGTTSPQETNKIVERQRNFNTVVSTASSDHLRYKRDLSAFLDITMKFKQYLLALDLANEIFDDVLSRNQSQVSFETMIATMRKIGRATVESFDSNDRSGRIVLKRLLRLFQRANGSESGRDDWVVHGQVEILDLLHHASSSVTESNLLALVRFLAEESPPKEMLQALFKWSSGGGKVKSSGLHEVLRLALGRGANDNRSMVELSNSLRYVRDARVGLRSRVSDEVNSSDEIQQRDERPQFGEVWKSMSLGMLPLSK